MFTQMEKGDLINSINAPAWIHAEMSPGAEF